MDFSYIDIGLLAIVVLFLLNGLRNGFIRAAGNLIGAVIGVIGSWYVMVWLQDNYSIFSHPMWAVIIFVGLIMAMSKIVGFIVDMIDEAWKLITIIPFLKSINKLLGGILGLFEGILMIAAIAYFAGYYFAETQIGVALLGSPIISWLGFVIKIVAWLTPKVAVITS
ncbi:MAG: CvpA family protein [Candidatus Uhrbacteria bacterium]|nr:CvpA family protein [Candidatus Uhrbacteria bacterium]